jgi:hypothetical protein
MLLLHCILLFKLRILHKIELLFSVKNSNHLNNNGWRYLLLFHCIFMFKFLSFSIRTTFMLYCSMMFRSLLNDIAFCGYFYSFMNPNLRNSISLRIPLRSNLYEILYLNHISRTMKIKYKLFIA